MHINDLTDLLEALAVQCRDKGTADHAREVRADIIDVIADAREGLPTHGRGPHDPWHFDLAHVLRVGLEETRKAHTVVEGLRDQARAEIADRERAAENLRIDQTREAVLRTCLQQVETIPEVRALARGEMPDGSPLRGNAGEVALRRLAENIANNVASYATLQDADDGEHVCDDECRRSGCTAEDA